MRLLLVSCLLFHLAHAQGIPKPTFTPCSMMDGTVAITGYPGALTASGRIEVRVDGWAIGNGPPSLELSPGMCSFFPGRRTLIYSRGNTCLQAELTENAIEQLNDFATLRTGRSIVRGSVMEVFQSGPDRPHAGAIVMLEGRHAARAISRRDGSFEMVGVPGGNYRLLVEDSGFRPVRPAREIWLEDRGCATLPQLGLERYGIRERAQAAVNSAIGIAAWVASAVERLF